MTANSHRPKATPQQIDAAAEVASRRLGVAMSSLLNAARERPVVRARFLALAGLKAALPDHHFADMARQLRFHTTNPSGKLDQARLAAWWREDWAAEVADAVKSAHGDRRAA